ncbi:hypothetical protein YYC_03543 [Plasmodium yoelii 17X]|uniref:Uncharacterized protein n=1 Tax=Plasmodium yoelii 17X TaxID=1323249 RepID=V7PH04_PLAYE|nr:hypothetical protein YYC_03543 [Plasmodium yoelii 17X]
MMLYIESESLAGSPENQIKNENKILAINENQILAINENQILPINENKILALNDNQILPINENKILAINDNPVKESSNEIIAFCQNEYKIKNQYNRNGHENASYFEKMLKELCNKYKLKIKNESKKLVKKIVNNLVKKLFIIKSSISDLLKKNSNGDRYYLEDDPEIIPYPEEIESEIDALKDNNREDNRKDAIDLFFRKKNNKIANYLKDNADDKDDSYSYLDDNEYDGYYKEPFPTSPKNKIKNQYNQNGHKNVSYFEKMLKELCNKYKLKIKRKSKKLLNKLLNKLAKKLAKKLFIIKSAISDLLKKNSNGERYYLEDDPEVIPYSKELESEIDALKDNNRENNIDNQNDVIDLFFRKKNNQIANYLKDNADDKDDSYPYLYPYPYLYDDDKYVKGDGHEDDDKYVKGDGHEDDDKYGDGHEDDDKYVKGDGHEDDDKYVKGDGLEDSNKYPNRYDDEYDDEDDYEYLNEDEDDEYLNNYEYDDDEYINEDEDDDADEDDHKYDYKMINKNKGNSPVSFYVERDPIVEPPSKLPKIKDKPSYIKNEKIKKKTSVLVDKSKDVDPINHDYELDKSTKISNTNEIDVKLKDELDVELKDELDATLKNEIDVELKDEIDVTLRDEVYDETERLLFERIINQESPTDKHNSVEKILNKIENIAYHIIGCHYILSVASILIILTLLGGW